jgi:hypothetical protein
MPQPTRLKDADPDKAFRQLDDEQSYKYLLLDSPMAEQLFAKHYLDLELDPYQVFILRLLRGRFSGDEELWRFINDNEMDWMFENGWMRHVTPEGSPKEGVSPDYWEKPNVLILVPAGFGKTTLVTTRVLPVMELCDNPNSRTQFIGKNETEAFSFSTNIRHELANPKLVADFGEFRPGDKTISWANQSFSVAQRQFADVRDNCEFYGTNSHAALGKRSDRVLIDDIETPDTASTPETRQKLLHWVRIGPLTSARPIWNKNARGDVMIPKRLKWSKTARYWGTGLVGTVFHPEALYALVMKDPTFTCVKFDCFKDKKCSISLSDKMLSVKDLERERRSIGTLAFNKRYRNIAYNEEEMAFREAWIRGHEEEVAGIRVQHPGCLDRGRSFGEFDRSWELYCGFDPASGSKSRWSAHSAYVVLGIDRNDPEKNVFLIDYRKIQDNFDRMLDNLLEGNPLYNIEGLYSKYHYKQATVEKNAFGLWLIENDRMKPYIRSGTVKESYTGRNKRDPVAGVFAMGEMMQNGRFRIPYAFPSDQEKAEEFIAELLVFPKSTGDVVMAMWLAHIPLSLENGIYRSWFSKGGSGITVRNLAHSR